jgi:hypothetical protein
MVHYYQVLGVKHTASSEEIKATLMNGRNDFLHGNIDPTQTEVRFRILRVLQRLHCICDRLARAADQSTSSLL